MLNCSWTFFLTLQRSENCRGQGSLACPGCRQTLGIPAPWHATGFAICLLPLLILCAGARTYFRSRNGTRKEQKECVGSRTLHGGAHPGRGCSGSSSGAQLSFPAGIFPLWEHLGGPSLPHRLRTPCAWAPWGRDTALALQMTPLFFSLKVRYQTAASYGGAGLSLLHYGTAQPSFTTPGPVTSPSRLHPCHGRLWGHVLSPPLPVGAAPCQGQAARLLRVSISA